MSRNRYSDEIKQQILQEAEAGVPLNQLARNYDPFRL